jgi:hypothetical protein
MYTTSATWRRWARFRFSVLSAVAVGLTTGSHAEAVQEFYVDFVGPGGALPAYTYTYTEPQKAFVIDYLNERFLPHGMEFFAGPRPDAKLFSASLITLNDPAFGGGAEHTDFRNEVHNDHADINALSIFDFVGMPAPSLADMAIGTANLVAHEAEHLMGVRHHDALSPVGMGLGAGITPTEFKPTYPGPSLASDTGMFFAALHAGGSLSAGTLTSPLYVSEREAARLTAAQFPFVHTDETAPDNHAVEKAQPVPVPLVALPYPFRPPTPPGEPELVALNVNLATVSGEFDPKGDGTFLGDYYTFEGSMGQLWTIEGLSYILEGGDRYADNADIAIALLDGRIGEPSAGALIGYYSSSAINDDDDDIAPGGGSYLGATLLDVILPYTGPYVIEVFVAGPALGLGKSGMDGGRYELFIYNTMPVAVPEPSTLALFVLGAIGLFSASRRCKTRYRG